MSVYLGLAIKAMLEDSQAVTDIVDDKIYPAVALEGFPSYPVVVFNTQITGADYSKGGEGVKLVQDSCAVEIQCLSKTWDEAIELQAAVRAALEGRKADKTMETVFVADPLTVANGGCEYNVDLSVFNATMLFETFTQPVEDGD